jgi:tetratricopeptide (TPR) repeat protein
MGDLAHAYPKDDEAQIFYALSLVATDPLADKAHVGDKQAAAILEPIWKRQPQHPGVPHYLIHAYDSAELARQGLPAARAYSKIAPSAPHALHMPSHIFTRLGMWDDSIASNRAAIATARAQGDIGEQLHAMDYLTYALLQRGRWPEAAAVVSEVGSMKGLPAALFKAGYAANAIPARYAVERRDWAAAAALQPLPGSPPAVVAMVHWARALGHSRASPPASADADIADLEADLATLRAAGDDYWAVQTDIMLREGRAWQATAKGDHAGALAALTAVADEEDAVEKQNVTPGPVVPAREQLGEMLLAEGRPADALRAFQTSLAAAPGRRGALVGGIAAARALGKAGVVRQFEAALR